MSKASKPSILATWPGFRTANGQEDSARPKIAPKKTLKSIMRAKQRTSATKQVTIEEFQNPLLPQAKTPLSRLENLPVDVLYLIASVLPSEAIYSLSLTSRTLSHFFPRDQLTSKDPLTKKHFLILLENDRPDYLVCYTCNRLYRWRVPGSHEIRLCPGRKDIPHHDYGRLDIKSHSKRIPREMIDLTLRGTAKGSKHGTTLKQLTKSLQEKESLDRHLRMRAHSYVLTSVMNNSLLVTMVFGVRIPTTQTSHPLYWLARHNIPNDNFLLPPAREFRHPRFSTFTRILGCNYHEFLMFDGVSNSDDYAFLACSDCKSSIRIARDYYSDRWINVNVETTQAFGTRENLSGETWCYAGLTREHRAQQPNEVIHFMRCLTPVSDQPAFATRRTTGAGVGNAEGEADVEDEARDMDLSLNAWFNRHVHSYTQRVWARTPDDPAQDNDGNSTSDDDDDDEPADTPIYSDDAWNVPGPSRVTQTTLSVRKRWFEISMIGLVACIWGPVIVYREVKNALSASRRRRRAGSGDGTDVPVADGDDAAARPPQDET